MEKIENVQSTGKLQLVDTRNLVIDNKEFFGEGLLDCYVTHPSIFGDSRGFFENSFDIGDEEFVDSIIKDDDSMDRLSDDQKKMQELFGFINKENTSNSAKGTIRGMHYQNEPRCQTKLVRVTNGKAIDVVVDVRKDSPTFGKWFGVLLTKENHRQLLVPKGFAHGFLALENDTTFEYLVDEGYHKETEDGIPWDDESVGIDWDIMFKQYGITDVLTSDKDKLHSSLDEKVANDELTFTVASSRDTNRARLMKSNLSKKEELERIKKLLEESKQREEKLLSENSKLNNRIDNLNRELKNIKLHGEISNKQINEIIKTYSSEIERAREVMLDCGSRIVRCADEMQGVNAKVQSSRKLKYTNPDLNSNITNSTYGEC